LVAVSKIIDFGTNSVYVAESISTEDKSLINKFYTQKLLLLGISIPNITDAFIYFKTKYRKVSFIFHTRACGLRCKLHFNASSKDEKFIHLVSLNTLPALIKGIFAF